MSIKKKFTIPLIFLVLFVLSIAFHLDGLMMIILMPVGLLMIGIYEVTGIQFTNIWVDVFVMLVFTFVIGLVFDFIQTKIIAGDGTNL